ncbi:hypothetical protein [Virgisporangium aurantiacum]|uniref:Uncharacterized protein n=1 Tax=Virgisporangium aurantiacum TaxID=175570 RepID=A0A8J3ZCY7_9ACTN|nr:hypothetical protein [Virgisporangium aurantiacum]GIJ61667.1 hypothetical protein Vau01_091830 [Virgisporangium aurantiacum]
MLWPNQQQAQQPRQGQQYPSSHGGTVYGAHEAGPSSAPPANTGDPYGAATPGLRNVGGPASNQGYYPNQQQPAFQAPNPVESSGSLTGHILGQGRADTPTPKSRTAKVVIILAVVLVVMVLLGLLAATLFNDMISDLLGGALG